MDILCLGELLADLIHREEIDEENGFHMFFGGAAGNVAVAAARLGLSAGVISKVGNDLVGDFLVRTLQENAVDTTRVVRDPARNSTLTLVTVDVDKVPAYLFFRENAASLSFVPQEIRPDTFADVRSMYFSSLFLAREGVRATNYEAVRLAQQKGVLIFFDPNVRLGVWESPEKAREEILRMAAQVDILKMNAEELEFLLGQGELEQRAAQAMERYSNLRLLVVTLGAEGAYFLNREGQGVYSPAYPADVVDTTGAGDAFLGALIQKMLQNGGDTTPGALQKMGAWANCAAYLTASRPGAISALPTQAEIERLCPS